MKTKLLLLLVLLLTTSISSLAFQEPQDYRVLFEKAKYTMETKADLQEAITLFESLITSYPDEKEYVAKSLLYQGMCYEKLGNQEAVKKYQRLVKNYPGQKQEVALAKERLSGLTVVAEIVKNENSEFNIKQVWADYELYRLGAPSPDGRYISYVNDTGVLGILEITTGKKLLLTNKGSQDEYVGGAQYSRWSADSKQIVYDWYNNKDDKIEIRTIGIDGSKPRILYKNEDVTWAQTYEWSPDGKQILACFYRKDGAQQIVLVSAEDGSVRVLKILEKEWPKNMSFSPDGHYIVYDFQQKENSSEHDIFLMSADGSREIPLVEHPADDYLLGWAPDGENILFASDRTGNLSAWLIAVANGLPQGTPKLVKPGIEQSVPLGFTSDGSFYYTLGGVFARDIFSVRIDPESGEILNQPKKLIENFEGHNLSPDYSPDGKHLVYVRRMESDILCIRSLETGEEQEFKLKLNPIDFPRWSPDGNSILIAGRGNNGLKLYQVDTQTGNLTTLFSPQENHYVGLFEWSPDGKSIFYGQASKTNNRTQIIHRELESGTVKELYLGSHKSRFNLSCSPDGKWLSFFMRGGTDLRIIPVEGGESRKLFNCNQGDTFSTLRWTADGKYILFVIRPSGNYVPGDENKCTLWRIPAEGGEPEKLGLEKDLIAHLSVHPDGQHIAYYNLSVLKNEVWKMENFLPLENLSQNKETKDLLIRKVIDNTEIEPLGSVSPDGRYISFVDWWTNSNLSIIDLETKEKRCVTDFKKEGDQAYYSQWSPDGKKLAYFWWEMGDTDKYNISVVDADGSNSKDLFKSDQVNWIELGNWSNDGNYLIATLSLRDERQSQIVRISSKDGSLQILRTINNPYLGGKPLLSPDSRYVAYNLPDDKATGNSDIYIYSIEDKSENALFKHPAHDYILGWTPNGKNILFASDRTGTVDAMIIPVHNGKATDSPKMVKSNIGSIVPMGFTHDGKFCYGDWPGQSNVFSAVIDIENGKTIKKPTLLINRFEGRNDDPSYSNNGKYLAYISERGIVTKGESENVLCIKNMETGVEDVVFPPYDIATSISYPAWSPDDNNIALVCKKDNHTIYRYNIPERKFSPLVIDATDQPYYTGNIFPQWSADGKTLYYLQISQDSDVSRILARNLDTGKDKELFRYQSEDGMDRFFNISISPDRKWISAINRGEKRFINLISTDDGQLKHLYSFDFKGGSSTPQVWSKDGKYIMYPYITKDNRWNLMRIPVDGGEKMKIELGVIGISSPSLHPDGRTLTFSSAGYSKPKNNFWVMENFLPKEETSNTQ